MKMAEPRNIKFNGITDGIIWQQMILYYIPIFLQSMFQQLFNTDII